MQNNTLLRSKSVYIYNTTLNPMKYKYSPDLMNKAKQYFEKRGHSASLDEIENYLDSMADLYLIFSEIRKRD